MSAARKRLILLSLAHAAVDFACAALFFGCLRFSDSGWISMVLYNSFAFAFQLPLGILADRFGRSMLFASFGCALVALAFLFVRLPVLAAVVAGLGNGAFHVGGGVEVMHNDPDRAGPLGVFVSPGAIGLFLGKFYADALSGLPVAPAAALVFAGLILLLTRGGSASPAPEFSLRPEKDGVPALVMLFLVVVLRSYMGLTPAFSSGALLDGRPSLSAGPIPGLIPVSGTAAGGYAADLIGARLASLLSLGACAVLLFIPAHPALKLAALFLFNMSMPITLHAAKKYLPGLAGGAFGLLTFALFIGIIPSILNLETPDSSALFGSLALVSLLFLLLGLGRKKPWNSRLI